MASSLGPVFINIILTEIKRLIVSDLLIAEDTIKLDDNFSC